MLVNTAYCCARIDKYKSQYTGAMCALAAWMPLQARDCTKTMTSSNNTFYTVFFTQEDMDWVGVPYKLFIGLYACLSLGVLVTMTITHTTVH